jgi:hypothetical protein
MELREVGGGGAGTAYTAANLLYTPQGVGVTPVSAESVLNEVVSINRYGASPGATASANLAAIQKAIDSLPAGGGILTALPGIYNLFGTVGVTKPIFMLGSGSSNSGTVFNQTGTNTLSFSVNTAESVSLLNFQLRPGAGGTGIKFDSTPTTTQNVRSNINNVMCYGGAIGVDFTRAMTFTVEKYYGALQTTASISIRNASTATQDIGDSNILSSVIDCGAASGASGIMWYGSGGLRVANNKFQNGVANIDLAPETGVNTSDILLVGNSFENSQYGVRAQSPLGGLCSNLMITGNQFAIQSVAQIFFNSANFRDIAIVGNVFANGTTGVIPINLAALDGAEVSGNMFNGNNVTTNAIVIGTNAANVNVGPNKYKNITGAPITSANATALLSGIGTPFTFAQLPSACANGSFLYCSDGLAGSAPLTGGGTGTFAKKINGVWVG